MISLYLKLTARQVFPESFYSEHNCKRPFVYSSIVFWAEVSVSEQIGQVWNLILFRDKDRCNASIADVWFNFS